MAGQGEYEENEALILELALQKSRKLALSKVREQEDAELQLAVRLSRDERERRASVIINQQKGSLWLEEPTLIGPIGNQSLLLRQLYAKYPPDNRNFCCSSSGTALEDDGLACPKA